MSMKTLQDIGNLSSASTALAQKPNGPCSSTFEPTPLVSHLEWSVHPSRWTVVRRAPNVAPDVYRPLNADLPCLAYALHPQHPLLPKFGFRPGFSGVLLYVAELRFALWSETLQDVESMLWEMFADSSPRPEL